METESPTAPKYKPKDLLRYQYGPTLVIFELDSIYQDTSNKLHYNFKVKSILASHKTLRGPTLDSVCSLCCSYFDIQPVELISRADYKAQEKIRSLLKLSKK